MWKSNDIRFHQPIFNPLLQQFLPNLDLARLDTILVPLCGKSLDMNLLLDSGYKVMGVELSNIAIKAYFEARQVTATREKRGRFIIWRHKHIEIWCGDIFDLTSKDIGHIHTLYDCSSMTALPAESRSRYIQHFHKILSNNNQILLITTETPDDRQRHSEKVIDSEVKSLYENNYDIHLLHGNSSMKHDPSFPDGFKRIMEDKVYLFKSRGLPDL